MTQSNRGFTLVEVLVTMVTFTIAMTGLVALLTGTIQANALAKRMTAAGSFAQDKLEEVRNEGSGGCDNGTMTDGGMTYTVTCTTAGGPTGDTLNVTVTVAWTDKESHTITLTTTIPL